MSFREDIHHRGGGGTKQGSHCILGLTLHTGHLISICRVCFKVSLVRDASGSLIAAGRLKSKQSSSKGSAWEFKGGSTDFTVESMLSSSGAAQSLKTVA